MDYFQLGEIKVTVDDPYPCWIRIKGYGSNEIAVSHTNISDLIAILKRAKQAARRRLPEKSKNEVD